MLKSSDIINIILKDVKAFVLEKYENVGVKLWKTDIKHSRQLFSTSSTNGWVDKTTSSTLHILSTLSEYASIQYPNIILTIRQTNYHLWAAGDIVLQDTKFGNIAEPGVINRIKTEICRGINNS